MSAAPRTVDRLTPQMAIDAAKISSHMHTLVRLLNDAAAHREQRRHTNAATLERQARSELVLLSAALQTHFMRFADEASK